jgi:hypothetical protein
MGQDSNGDAKPRTTSSFQHCACSLRSRTKQANDERTTCTVNLGKKNALPCLSTNTVLEPLTALKFKQTPTTIATATYTNVNNAVNIQHCSIKPTQLSHTRVLNPDLLWGSQRDEEIRIRPATPQSCNANYAPLSTMVAPTREERHGNGSCILPSVHSFRSTCLKA